MAFGKNLIFLIPLFFVLSCAQVGTISGGEEDEIAPQPVPEKTIPPNESLNFQGKKVEITFDEYIQLNNPQQTVVFVPNDAKPKISLHKKTVKIEWEEDLKANTTYVIYLNGTIKDVTESNDSLMYYVFSTGDILDSLKYNVRVVDAWTNQPLPNATVGLFTHTDSLKPYYFANSSISGEAKFSFIKAGNYFLKAFIDENKDLQIQNTEKIAFRSEAITIDSSMIDTVSLRLFKSENKKKIRTFKYIAPGSVLVGANYSLENASFFINDTKVDDQNIHSFSTDSVQLFTNVTNQTGIKLVVKTKDHSDTVSMRLTEKEKIAKIQLLSDFKSQQVGPHEQISFHIHDVISSVDTTKFSLLNPLDSSEIIPYKTTFRLNQIFVEFDRKNYTQIVLNIQAGAVKTILQQQNDSLKTTLFLSSKKDYGAILLDASDFEGPIIIDLLQGSKVITTLITKSPSKHLFSNLLPGEYQFRIISDANENGIWDTGNLEKDIQAEIVYWFSTTVKVRANWDIDLKLTPTN